MSVFHHIKKISIPKYARVLLLIFMFLMPLQQSHGIIPAFPVFIFEDIFEAVKNTPQMIADVAQMAISMATGLADLLNVFTIISDAFSDLLDLVSSGFGIPGFDPDDITAISLPGFD